MKVGYKLKLQTPETMKLFGSTKKLINKAKNGENVPNLEISYRVLLLNRYNTIFYRTKNKKICHII